MPQISFAYCISSVIFSVLCFSLCLLVTYICIKKIDKIFSHRKERIQKQLQTIQNLKKVINKTQIEYNSKLNQAKSALHAKAQDAILSFCSNIEMRLRKLNAEHQQKISKIDAFVSKLTNEINNNKLELSQYINQKMSCSISGAKNHSSQKTSQ